MARVVILGATANQTPLVRRAVDAGHHVTVFDPSPSAPAAALAHDHVVVDLADEDACMARMAQRPPDAVVTAAADFPVRLLAAACARFGLPGPSPEAALACTDKHRMAEALTAAGVGMPATHLATDPAAAVRATRDLGVRAILKPVRGQGGRGVSEVAADASDAAIEAAWRHAAEGGRDGVLVQAFIDGPEMSVESVTSGGHTTPVAITAKRTSGPPFHVEVGHVVPAPLSDDARAAVHDTVIRAMAALGVDACVSHVELRLTPSGPVIMEAACRMGGGFIGSDLVPLATGVDLLGAVLDLALGRPADLRPRDHAGAAAVSFIPPVPGRLAAIHGQAEANASAGVVRTDLWVRPGSLMGPLDHNGARPGYVIATGSDAPTATARADEAAAQIRLEIG